MPKTVKDSVSATPHAENLTRVFGGAIWEKLYVKDEQTSYLNEQKFARSHGHDHILELYKSRLKTLFGKRLLDKTWPLRNSKNSRLFEFIFCAGNPKGRKIAHRIARHIIDNA